MSHYQLFTSPPPCRACGHVGAAVRLRLIVLAILMSVVALPSYSLVNSYPAQTMFYFKERGGASVVKVYFYDEPTVKTLAASVGTYGYSKGYIWAESGSTWDLFKGFELGMKYMQTPYGFMPSGEMGCTTHDNELLLIGEGFSSININGTIYDLCDQSEWDRFVNGVNIINSGVAPAAGGGYSSGSSSSSHSHSSAYDTCRICHGNGRCTSCNGTGTSLYTYGGSSSSACASCHGTGKCFKCHGTGRQ